MAGIYPVTGDQYPENDRNLELVFLWPAQQVCKTVKSLPDNNISIDRGKGLSAESVSGTLRQPFLGGMLYVFYNVYMKRATFRGGGVGPPCC